MDVLLGPLRYHDLLLESDFVVLALPLTPDTRWIFGEDEIEILPKSACVFNIGRGGLVDERYLIQALKNRWIAGAGLTVFADEPLPPHSPLWDLPNCTLTPHAGGEGPHLWPRLARLVAEQVSRWQRGEPLAHRVDPTAGY
jgi:phosphoglycerate dehydrogenase-like enzyme